MAEARIIKDSWVNEYIRFCKAQESPELYHRWTAYAVISGVLKRRVFLELSYGNIYPNLYVVLVGPTAGPRKTTASDMGVNFLDEIAGVDVVREKLTPEGLLSRMGGKDLIIATNNGKPGEKQDIKIKQDCSVFVHAPELSVLFGNQNYTNGLIELFTTLFDNKTKFNYLTQKRGMLSLKEPTLSLLGASNPEWLAKSFNEDAFGGGFMGRTLFVYQRTRSKKVALPEVTEGEKFMKTLLKTDLHKISKLKGPMHFDKDARDMYVQWYNEYEAPENSRLAGYYQRKPTHLLKIAMLSSVSKSDELALTCEDIGDAILMLEQLEQTMQSAFAYIGTTNEARIAEFILEILQNKGGMIHHKDLFHDVRHRIRTSKEFNDITNTLEEAGLMRIVMGEKGRTYYSPDRYREKEKADKAEKEQAKVEQLEERRIKNATIQ